MNLASIRENEATSGIEMSPDPRVLGAIHKAGCPAAIWQRTPLPRFQSWIDAVPASNLPKLRAILQPGSVRRAIFEHCEAKGLPDCDERTMLIDDIAAMADIFADLMQSPYLRLRLDVVTTNACRKFHIDAVTARLVCTYLGTATQYGFAGEEGDVENIHTVGTGSALVLRGTLWPVVPKSGLLHRSPPIEGTGETRLVLVLDPVDGPTEEDAHHHLH